MFRRCVVNRCRPVSCFVDFHFLPRCLNQLGRLHPRTSARIEDQQEAVCQLFLQIAASLAGFLRLDGFLFQVSQRSQRSALLISSKRLLRPHLLIPNEAGR